MRSSPVPAALFVQNRSRLARMMSPGSIALIWSGERKMSYGDQHYPFRQKPDFFYLTGINHEKSLFALSPDHPDPELREIMFINKPTQKSELWRGRVPGPEQVRLLSGIGQVRWLEELDAYLKLLINRETMIYADQEAGTQEFSNKTPLTPLLQRLRMIKQPLEIEEIKRVVSITRSAFLRALKPSNSRYSSIFVGLMLPQCSVAMFFWNRLLVLGMLTAFMVVIFVIFKDGMKKVQY